jgi:hypothetical protein
VPPERIAEIHFFQPIKQGGVESGVAVVVENAAPETPRMVVYAASYRLTLKGLDRGKWEVNIVAEADAPLVAVDAVVRGCSGAQVTSTMPRAWMGMRFALCSRRGRRTHDRGHPETFLPDPG